MLLFEKDKRYTCRCGKSNAPWLSDLLEVIVRYIEGSYYLTLWACNAVRLPKRWNNITGKV
ncbi:hypothetical protein Tco_0640058, partial [Tanacetum coccineum]